MCIAESIAIEEEYKTRMTSSDNQIAFATSLTRFFLRKEDGPSKFHGFLKESAKVVAGFMLNWTSKRKIKTYAVIGAVRWLDC